MILLLLAYNLSEVQIFHSYLIYALRLFLSLGHPITGFQIFLRLILVASDSYVVSEPFTWLVLNRLHKTSSSVVHQNEVQLFLI